LGELDFVAFDTETTGLHPARERVIELSAVKFRLDGEGDHFDELIDPQRPIPQTASRINNIKDADVAGKPTIESVLPRFAEFIGNSVLVAHNAEFDVSFLAHEAKRCGVALPRVPVIDSVEIARRLRPELPNHKLETVGRALGCNLAQQHRALADARTLREVFTRLVASLSQENARGLFALACGALSFGPDERLWMWLPPELAPLERAFESGGRVTIVYEPEGKRQDAPEITPRSWMRRPGATFLMAHCEREHADRSYRLDWITRAQHAQATLF
jgi:DNA polymerase III epsilon subunit family exonuclease